jgi:hypothetical protein
LSLLPGWSFFHLVKLGLVMLLVHFPVLGILTVGGGVLWVV